MICRVKIIYRWMHIYRYTHTFSLSSTNDFFPQKFSSKPSPQPLDCRRFLWCQLFLSLAHVNGQQLTCRIIDQNTTLQQTITKILMIATLKSCVEIPKNITHHHSPLWVKQLHNGDSGWWTLIAQDMKIISWRSALEEQTTNPKQKLVALKARLL